MATLRKHYSVSRPVYSEDSFAEDHEKVHRRRKTMLDHVKQYLTWVNKSKSLALNPELTSAIGNALKRGKSMEGKANRSIYNLFVLNAAVIPSGPRMQRSRCYPSLAGWKSTGWKSGCWVMWCLGSARGWWPSCKVRWRTRNGRIDGLKDDLPAW